MNVKQLVAAAVIQNNQVSVFNKACLRLFASLFFNNLGDGEDDRAQLGNQIVELMIKKNNLLRT